MHDALDVQTVNGWSNRETWLANLWLNNDEYSYQILMDALSINGDIYAQAEWLENHLHDQLDDEIERPCLWQDLLRTAFGRISWIEVIEKNLE